MMDLLSGLLMQLFFLGLLLGGWVVITIHAETPRIWLLSSSLALVLWMLVSGASGLWWLFVLLLWGVPVLLWGVPELRQSFITQPLWHRMRKALPPLSKTEREALEAGQEGWEAALFAGSADWPTLLHGEDAPLGVREQEFLDGPVAQLCTMLDDWRISTQDFDLPPEVWARLREDRFFGMAIPQRYEGLEFSARAHSEVVMKIAARSVTAAVTVMVPNSLGPGKLLLRYGTEAQKERYLSALARGEQTPCFGLTSPRAGSDAASLRDSGVVCTQQIEDEDVLGIRLNWEKRYITLAPVASLIGLAFRLYDPDGLLGNERDLGITLALVPADSPGVEIGWRHLPMQVPFMNGPIRGRDVFVPLEQVIGERDGVGRGWEMLMACLGEGRAISLPALAVAAGKHAVRQTGAYAAVRRQFSLPLSRFEGVQEALARIAGNTYLMDAVRVEVARLEQIEECSSVASAIAKQQLTERMRRVVNDSMDVHAGVGICSGPRNPIARLYQAAPIAITVEGANLLTRNMIIFGQGLMRCHPYLLEEMRCLQGEDSEIAAQEFDALLCRHAGGTAHNLCRLLALNWSGARYPGSGTPKFCRSLARQSLCFAWMVDVMLLRYGGSLKRRERLSARLADMLSALYLSVCVVRRHAAVGAPEEDVPLRDWALRECGRDFEAALDDLIDNLEDRTLRMLLRLTRVHIGGGVASSPDALDSAVAALITTPGPARERLCAGLPETLDDTPGAKLEQAFVAEVELEPVRRVLREAVRSGEVREDETATDLEQAVACGALTAEEAERLRQAEHLLDDILAVDVFEPGELQRDALNAMDEKADL